MTKFEIVKQILASDIIGWVLAFLGGFLVFKVVDNMQTSIERHNVIKDVENSINALFSQPIAKSNKCSRIGNNQEIKYLIVRTVLHDDSPWEEYIKGETEIVIENNQRFVQIRKGKGYKEYISTQAIHELLILFRRIEKLYKDSILKPIDLADMWREILPFGTSGRLKFYKSYLGESDIKSIIFVLFNTVLACEKHEVYNAVKYFVNDFLNDESMEKLYIKNSRYTFKEKFKIKRFFKIVKKYE
jgi:hypothetical protein